MFENHVKQKKKEEKRKEDGKEKIINSFSLLFEGSNHFWW